MLLSSRPVVMRMSSRSFAMNRCYGDSLRLADISFVLLMMSYVLLMMCF